MDRKAKLIYTDYDYLSEDEAAYQGYDTDGDSDYSVGFTVNEYERKREAREALETNNNEEGCQDSEVSVPVMGCSITA